MHACSSAKVRKCDKILPIIRIINAIHEPTIKHIPIKIIVIETSCGFREILYNPLTTGSFMGRVLHN